MSSFKKAWDLSKDWKNPKGWQEKAVRLSAYPHEDLLDMVDRYAEDNPYFNNDFCESLREALDHYGDLTLAQREALENIVSKFKMYR